MAKRKGQDLHVLPRDHRWAVQSEGSTRAVAVHATQREAVTHAREIARSQGGTLVIHGRDGQIRAKERYGADLLPLQSASDRPALRQEVQLATTFEALLGDDDTTDESADDIIHAVRTWREVRSFRSLA